MPYEVPHDEVTRLFPQYELIRRLTPSEQKCAFHVRGRDGRDLCLKLIAPGSEMERLRREIEAMLAIDHSMVVRFEEYTFSISNEGVRHYVVEEFVPGVDLSEVLNGAPWAPSVALSFFGDLLSGLEALHNANIVHRDLKPSNVRVHEDGYPVVIDMGLARHLARPDITRTVDGAAIGTPKYFAPEQFRGTKRDIDVRTDLFAVGILLYEAVVGIHPFYVTGMSYDALATRVCDGHDGLGCSEYDALPQSLRLVLAKLLARSRARRPASATQAKAMLEKSLERINA